MARVSVFGLGYVGCVSAGCLAKEGHEVVGVDVAREKVDLINRGAATIIEDGVQDLIATMVSAGRLRATTDVVRAVAETEVVPARSNSGRDLMRGHCARGNEIASSVEATRSMNRTPSGT